MSKTGVIDRGYPRSKDDKSTNVGGITRVVGFRILSFCGAIGGFTCPSVLGATQYVYAIPVSKFLVYTRSMLFENSTYGVDIYTDAGADAFCTHNLGTRQPFYLGFSSTGVLTDAEVKAQGNSFNDALPYQIEILGDRLPQPILKTGAPDPNWDNKIYVHIVWDSSAYVQQSPMFDNILKLAKHNFDIKI